MLEQARGATRAWLAAVGDGARAERGTAATKNRKISREERKARKVKKIRNPNIEIRNKRWQTNPKYQIVQTSESAPFEFFLFVHLNLFRISNFVLRI
jgi:hypothetical protein